MNDRTTRYLVWGIFLILVLVVLFAGPPARANTLTGEQLREMCVTESTAPSCNWYVAGYVSALVILSQIASPGHQPCFPNNQVTHVDAMTAVAEFFNARPDLWEYPASMLVHTALTVGFPCGAGERPMDTRGLVD